MVDFEVVTMKAEGFSTVL